MWHTVPKRTKIVLGDLGTLRRLVQGLLRYDCVTFLRFLESLRAAEGQSSLWLFDDAAFTVFEQVRGDREIQRALCAVLSYSLADVTSSGTTSMLLRLTTSARLESTLFRTKLWSRPHRSA